MPIMKKYPGQFEAILSVLSLGAMVVIPLIFSRLRSPFQYHYVMILSFIIFWVLSWGSAISAVRNGAGRGKVLGFLALVLVVIFNVLLAMVSVAAV